MRKEQNVKKKETQHYARGGEEEEEKENTFGLTVDRIRVRTPRCPRNNLPFILLLLRLLLVFFSRVFGVPSLFASVEPGAEGFRRGPIGTG